MSKDASFPSHVIKPSLEDMPEEPTPSPDPLWLHANGLLNKEAADAD